MISLIWMSHITSHYNAIPAYLTLAFMQIHAVVIESYQSIPYTCAMFYVIFGIDFYLSYR